MAAPAGALPGRERQVLHAGEADAAENRESLGLHEGVVGSRLLPELAETGLLGAGGFVPVSLVFLVGHEEPSGVFRYTEHGSVFLQAALIRTYNRRERQSGIDSQV